MADELAKQGVNRTIHLVASILQLSVFRLGIMVLQLGFYSILSPMYKAHNHLLQYKLLTLGNQKNIVATDNAWIIVRYY